MRKTRKIPIFPMSKGLDTNSIPGAQEIRSLKTAKNVIIKNTGSLKKKPHPKRIDYIGSETGNLQGAIQFFAYSGGSQRSEIIRVKNGRVEAIRNGVIVDLDLAVSPTDVVTFERFANALIIHFENTRPQYYTIGGSLANLTVFSGHDAGPPTFSRFHDYRLWYGGRSSNPHVLTASEINDPNDYTLANGGFSMRVYDGDGDPIGLTGLSPTFKGDLYAFKSNSIYRIYRNAQWYGIDPMTNEAGCVHHNTIAITQNDMFFVSTFAIHSLKNTASYGAVEESTISYPIYEYFQDNVNWSSAKTMTAAYDKPSGCYLLSFASAGSSQNDRVIGFNIKSGEFFEWQDVYYPVLAKYFDLGRQKTMVGDQTEGLGILDDAESTNFGDAVSIEILTGVIFPLQNPVSVCAFTKAWVVLKPTLDSVSFDFTYWINGNRIKTMLLNTLTEGSTFEGVAGGLIGTGIIGTALTGNNKSDITIVEAELSGEGSSIQFQVKHSPTAADPDQSFEIYGIVFEIDFEEDTDQKVII